MPYYLVPFNQPDPNQVPIWTFDISTRLRCVTCTAYGGRPTEWRNSLQRNFYSKLHNWPSNWGVQQHSAIVHRCSQLNECVRTNCRLNEVPMLQPNTNAKCKMPNVNIPQSNDGMVRHRAGATIYIRCSMFILMPTISCARTCTWTILFMEVLQPNQLKAAELTLNNHNETAYYLLWW